MDTFKDQLHVLSLAQHPRVGIDSPVRLLDGILLMRILGYVPLTYSTTERDGYIGLTVNNRKFISLGIVASGYDESYASCFHNEFLYIANTDGSLRIKRISLLDYHIENICSTYSLITTKVLYIALTDKGYISVLTMYGSFSINYVFIPYVSNRWDRHKIYSTNGHSFLPWYKTVKSGIHSIIEYSMF